MDTCEKCNFQQTHAFLDDGSERRNFSCEMIDGNEVCVCSQCLNRCMYILVYLSLFFSYIMIIIIIIYFIIISVLVFMLTIDISV